MKAIRIILGSLLTAGLVLAMTGASWNPYTGEGQNIGMSVMGICMMIIGGLPLVGIVPEGKHERGRD